MEVILLEKVGSLGNLGDQVKVKSGYGRNYLIPQGKAALATKENIAQFETQRAELEKTAADALEKAQQRFKELDQLEITVAAQVAEGGKLYGSVSVNDIVKAVQAIGKETVKGEILLPEGPIKEVGNYDVGVQIHGDIVATLKVKVIPEEK